MKLDETSQKAFTQADLEKYLQSYKPRSSYGGQWERLRPQILDLIRLAEPKTQEMASTLLVCIGHLLVDAASSHFEGSLNELLTVAGIERNQAQLNTRGMALKTVQSVAANQTKLHRILHDLPIIISDEPQRREASVPLSSQEFDELAGLFSWPRNSVDLDVTRRFILALGAGVIGESADRARIFFGDRGISAIIDGTGLKRPLSNRWITRLGTLAIIDLEPYKTPQAQATAGWLRSNSLQYLWPRLRDEWLQEQLDGSESSFVQLRRAKVTDYDLRRMQLRWNQLPMNVDVNILRNSQTVHKRECAKSSQSHYPPQELNSELEIRMRF